MPSMLLRRAACLMVMLGVLCVGCGDTRHHQTQGVVGRWVIDAEESGRYAALVSVTSSLGDDLSEPSEHVDRRAKLFSPHYALQSEVLTLSTDGLVVYETKTPGVEGHFVRRGSYEVRNDTVVMKYPDGDGHELVLAVFSGSRIFRLPFVRSNGDHHLGGVFVRVE